MARWMVGLGCCAFLVASGCRTGDSSIGQPLEADGGGSATSGRHAFDTGNGASGSGTEGQTSRDSSDGPGGVEGDDGTTTGDPQLACPEYSLCSVATECEADDLPQCGHLLSRFDVEGCPRPFCETDEDCPDGHGCVLPRGWGSCGHHECGDNPEDGTCECPFVGLDCPAIGTCVSGDTVPPPEATGHDYCALFTDERSCNGAPTAQVGPIDYNRCWWFEGFEMDIGATCSEQVPTARCVYSHPVQPIGCENDETLRPVAGLDADEPDRITILYADDEYQPLYVEAGPEWVPCDWIESAECDCACL